VQGAAEGEVVVLPDGVEDGVPQDRLDRGPLAGVPAKHARDERPRALRQQLEPLGQHVVVLHHLLVGGHDEGYLCVYVCVGWG
jgi:hypothetical protein